jgi:hypothetical protein
MKFWILCGDLVQYSHFVTCVVVGPNAILSLVVPNPTHKEVFF